MNAQMSNLVCIVNRLNAALQSLKTGVEKELLEAAKKLVETQDLVPLPRKEIEPGIARLFDPSFAVLRAGLSKVDFCEENRMQIVIS